MAKGRTTKAASATPTKDSYQNFATMTGIGAGNMSTSGGYGFNPVTRNRIQLEWAYRGSWVVGQAVDVVANDMTREGVEVRSEDDPDDIKELERRADRAQVWKKLGDTERWARLYGGAVAFIMIDGQDPATELNLDSIRKDQFKGLLPLDRWSVWPTTFDLITEMGPEIGLPKFYDVMPASGVGIPDMHIHHSRVVRLDGIELPYWQRISENYWGLSVIERMWDRLVAFDSTTQGAAQLVYKAHLRMLKVKNLRDLIAQGGPGMTSLAKMINQMRAFQSNEGLSVIDSNDEFEAFSYTFSGLSDLMMQFAEQISGALEIPLVRLFGQSPAGFSTGESDLRNYYDSIKQKQESRLRAGVEKVYRVLYRSTFGRDPSKTFSLEFKALWQMTDEQRATVTQTTTSAILDAYDRQVIDRATALKELKQLSLETGVFTNITDDAITEAENDPAPTAEMLAVPAGARSLPQPDESGEDEPGGKGVPKKAA